MMIRYLIVDDEAIAHDIVKGYCDMLPNLQLSKHCYDAIEALEYLNEHSVDLIFLDLNMPKLKGFEFLRTLATPPKVIVTTAYKEYALESYDLNIVDYLLKPFSFERFLKAVNKIINTNTEKQIPVTQTPEKKSDSIFLRSNKKHIQVKLSDILYIEAAGNYSKVITSNEVITVREKFSDLLSMVDQIDLIQVHKSFAVSKKSIKSIEGNRLFLEGHIVPIGKTYRLNINNLLR